MSTPTKNTKNKRTPPSVKDGHRTSKQARTFSILATDECGVDDITYSAKRARSILVLDFTVNKINQDCHPLATISALVRMIIRNTDVKTLCAARLVCARWYEALVGLGNCVWQSVRSGNQKKEIWVTSTYFWKYFETYLDYDTKGLMKFPKKAEMIHDPELDKREHEYRCSGCNIPWCSKCADFVDKLPLNGPFECCLCQKRCCGRTWCIKKNNKWVACYYCHTVACLDCIEARDDFVYTRSRYGVGRYFTSSTCPKGCAVFARAGRVLEGPIAEAADQFATPASQ